MDRRMSSQPAETPQRPISTFDPEIFWAIHKQKIIAGALVLIVALLGAGIFYILKSIKTQQAEAAYAAADSVEGWEKVIREFPNSVAAGNSYLRLGEKFREDGKLSQSDTAYETFIREFPQHPLLVAGYMGLATNAEVENHPEKALDAYKNLVQQFGNSYLAPMALFYEARLTAAKGNLKEAQQLFESVVRRYPESIFSSEAGRRAGQIADAFAQKNPDKNAGISPPATASPQP
jgi:TolA-binding protein